MSDSEIFTLTKQFIEQKPAAVEALRELKKGTEIRLILDNSMECACFSDGKSAHLEKRLASNPDVEFRVLAEAIRRLSDLPGDNMAEMGIEICREILAGSIEVKVVTKSWFSLLNNGYLKIITKAGPDFLTFLATHGLSSFGRITTFIRSMR